MFTIKLLLEYFKANNDVFAKPVKDIKPMDYQKSLTMFNKIRTWAED